MYVFSKYFLTLTKTSPAEGARRGGICGQDVRHVSNLQPEWARQEKTNATNKQTNRTKQATNQLHGNQTNK